MTIWKNELVSYQLALASMIPLPIKDQSEDCGRDHGLGFKTH